MTPTTLTASLNTPATTADPSLRGHHHNEGHGRRLTAAFEALEAFPVLAESRNRVLRLFTQERPATAEVVAAVESDVALAIATLRLANRVDGRSRGRVDSVVRAVSVLSPAAVQALASRARTFDFFERSGIWEGTPERFRLHGVATQRAADRLAAELGYEDRDRLMVTALLHDIGKLVLAHAYPGYPRQVHAEAKTPQERIHRERRELGVDHALVGGVLARRWGLPKSIASTIERHHSDDADGEAALVRLADMLAHYSHGDTVSPAEMLATARLVGIGTTELRAVMYDLPYPSAGIRQRAMDPCPLSTRETEVLKRLGQGKVYKQIAHELELSTSTVRTHLHNIYGKLGAVDRAQAVLIATERGWI
ncbi:MAG TPA: HDOD domain-containing protein [Conexibacter sp.]|jgi:putative nucleotidyltransferase with HDIG domain